MLSNFILFSSGVKYVAGPINGNPYAQIDHALKARIRSKSDSFSKKPYDLAKGIEDLDGLLGDLGYTTEIPDVNQNTQILITKPNEQEVQAVIHMKPEINNNLVEGTSDNSEVAAYSLMQTNHDTNTPGLVMEGHISVAPELLLQTSPQGDLLQAPSSQRSSGSDDVFQGEISCEKSPTINDLYFDLTQSHVEADNKKILRKNLSTTRYDNVSYGSNSDESLHRNDSIENTIEIQPGTVATHVDSLSKCLFVQDDSNYNAKMGVPCPGLLPAEVVEEKVAKFNMRSQAPGQTAPQLTQVYNRGGFHKIEDMEQERSLSLDSATESAGMVIDLYLVELSCYSG